MPSWSRRSHRHTVERATPRYSGIRRRGMPKYSTHHRMWSRSAGEYGFLISAAFRRRSAQASRSIRNSTVSRSTTFSACTSAASPEAFAACSRPSRRLRPAHRALSRTALITRQIEVPTTSTRPHPPAKWSAHDTREMPSGQGWGGYGNVATSPKPTKRTASRPAPARLLLRARKPNPPLHRQPLLGCLWISSSCQLFLTPPEEQLWSRVTGKALREDFGKSSRIGPQGPSSLSGALHPQRYG